MARTTSTGETIESAIKTAPIAIAQSRRGCGARPRNGRKSDRISGPLARRDDPACHRFENAVRGLAANLGLGSQHEAVPERSREERLDMVGGHKLRPVECGEDSRGKHQQDL